MELGNEQWQALLRTEWAGFDLDDTLHEFRKASKIAASQVFSEIHQEYGISVENLESSYRQVLADMTAEAFTDGKLSSDYRRERFTALLQAYSIMPSKIYMDHLLARYKDSLATSLALKPGALDLMQKLKASGRRIIVISEGPLDAQEWTIQQLGLDVYVDVLVTSNGLRRSKTNGLFREVLKMYKIPAARMMYIGDNYIRDVVPARDEGILAVHLDEYSAGCREDEDESMKVSSLTQLGLLFNAC
ncbi:HAD-like protein [Aspergillus ambiguus]|uniref:HAD family hydrolase n=1 Tax=Aspergillus ambiguus TaxID=176160 RepID=UPI003CCD55FA